MDATEGGHLDIVRELLSYGADMSLKDTKRQNVLFHAMHNESLLKAILAACLTDVIEDFVNCASCQVKVSFKSQSYSTTKELFRTIKPL